MLLHINDESECSKLYGGNTETCFVLPGVLEAADELPSHVTSGRLNLQQLRERDAKTVADAEKVYRIL